MEKKKEEKEDEREVVEVTLGYVETPVGRVPTYKPVYDALKYLSETTSTLIDEMEKLKARLEEINRMQQVLGELQEKLNAVESEIRELREKLEGDLGEILDRLSALADAFSELLERVQKLEESLPKG